MRFLYTISIKIYSTLIHIAALFNPKARLWVNGRKNIFKTIKEQVKPNTSCIWFHFASLGEFEQGRPVLEKIRENHPTEKIIVTFFSPSGYELRKKYEKANHIFYLPIDTPSNAKRFLDLINPKMAIFTKYEFWHNYFQEMHNRNIPIYSISAIFRKKQVFFRWYGGFNRETLRYVTYFFVQDKFSVELLHTIGIQHAKVSGDTRFDRVAENAAAPKHIDIIANFTQGHETLIAGSTWPEDERLLAEIVKDKRSWKFVIAPHEIKEEKLTQLQNWLPANSSIRYSQLKHNTDITLENIRVVIIDNIGMLSSLYQYGKIAYIGGGFGVGIHNTLEAAGFGLPVIFGPNYEKFLEAKALIRNGGGQSISTLDDLRIALKKLSYPEMYEKAASASANYVANNKGATSSILATIGL